MLASCSWCLCQFSLITKLDKHKFFDRYSLLMHHDEQELREFGLTDEMLIDQEW